MLLGLANTLGWSITEWIQGMGFPLEAALRLLLAAVAGGMVGLEREMRGREAGFRTNVLVCVGSALVMLVSVSLANFAWAPPSSYRLQVDPGRIAYGVMTGVGFLGAGAIVQNRGSVRGLTTAAALWCVAAIGLAAGFGLYALCVFAALLVLAALWLLDYLENVMPRLRRRTITIRVPCGATCIADTIGFFKQRTQRVGNVGYVRSDNGQFVDLSLQIAFRSMQQYYDLERELFAHPDWQLLRVQQP